MNTKPPASGLARIVTTSVVALLLGLVIGNASTKADLRHAREEIEKLKKDLAGRGNSPTSLNSISTMLKLPEARNRPAPPPKPEPAAVAANPPPPSASNTVAASTNTPPRHQHPSFRKQLETASDLWKTRVDIARNSFISNVATSDEQAVQFDVIMAAMNLRLSNSIASRVETLKQEKDISTETGLRLLNALSGDLVVAYEDLDRTMPAGWRKQAGGKFAVYDFINPDVVMPLAEAQESMERGRGDRAGRTDTGATSP